MIKKMPEIPNPKGLSVKHTKICFISMKTTLGNQEAEFMFPLRFFPDFVVWPEGLRAIHAA